MLEYASIRLTFDCTTPTTDPTIIVATATSHTMPLHSARSGSKADRNTRTNVANAAAFTPVDMNPVTAGGAPSYASGVHMWNGTAATLNGSPTTKMPSASNCTGVADTACAATRLWTRSRRVLPARPYVNAIPYRKKALENAPRRKYLSAASVDVSDVRRIPVNT